MTDEIGYAAPRPAEFAALQTMARQAFMETFGPLYDAAPLAHYLDQAYGPGGTMARDLADASVRWRVATSGGAVIGYAKLTPLRAPAPAPQPGAFEVQQFYVLRPWQGRGVADRLMNWALDEARRQGAPEIYLVVFDHNHRAKRFYARHGFTEVGRCTFTIGDRVDDDRIWRRAL